MDLDMTSMTLALVFGSIGFAMFGYGRKQSRPMHLVAGLALMIVPYFVPGALLMAVVCGLLVALPFLIVL